MTSRKFMMNFKKIHPIDVHMADDGVVKAIGMGDVVMEMKTSTGVKSGILNDVWYIPKLGRNLLSVSKLAKHVDKIVFRGKMCLMEKSGKWFDIGDCVGKGLYILSMKPIDQDTTENEANIRASKYNESQLWHYRLGRIGESGLNDIIANNMADGISLKQVTSLSNCDSCAIGKQTRKKFAGKSTFETKSILEVIRSDVCGPM